MTNRAALKPVLLVRASGNESDAEELAQLGLTVVIDPYLSITTAPGNDGYTAATELLAELTQLGEGDWVVATSANGLKHWGKLYGGANLKTALGAAADRGVRFAAIGEASARLYSDFGIHQVLVSPEPYGESLATAILKSNHREQAGRRPRALIPAGNLAMPTFSSTLTKAGWLVTSRVVYLTETVSVRPASAAALARGEFSAVVLRSPSAVRAVIEHAGVTSVPVICGGKTTAAEAEAAGLRVAAVAAGTDSATIAQTVLSVLQTQTQGAY